MHVRVQARGRILGQKHCKLPAGRPVFSQSALRTDSIFGQVRDTTVQAVQVWTVGKGLEIRSEFSQTGCAACQLREYSVVGQFEISAYDPRDHQADQTYHKYDNASLWRNTRHPEGNSYSYEEKCPPVDVPHSSKLIMATRLRADFIRVKSPASKSCVNDFSLFSSRLTRGHMVIFAKTLVRGVLHNALACACARGLATKRWRLCFNHCHRNGQRLAPAQWLGFLGYAFSTYNRYACAMRAGSPSANDLRC